MKTVNRIFGLVLVVSLFFSVASPTQGFMIFDHQGRTRTKILIHRVHDAQWQIGYRFASHCPAEFRKEEDKLKQLITASLRVWLQPLREISAEPIVDDFHLMLQPDCAGTKDRLLLQPDCDGTEDRVPSGLETRITFLCEKGNSYAWIQSAGMRFPQWPDVFIRKGVIIDKAYILNIVHELGHAFGLADTYNYKGDDQNTGGLAETRGMQPSAVMAGMSGTTPKREPPYIKEDDRKGIIWLYKFTYENQLLDDCLFPDYVFEEDPAGCRPKYPLIHEVKYGHYLDREEILEQDPNLNINARDINGRTALHYAAMYKQLPVVKKLLARPDLSPYLRDKQGKTATDTAKEAGHDDIVELILAHPRALSVSPKGNTIAVTWGGVEG